MPTVDWDWCVVVGAARRRLIFFVGTSGWQYRHWRGRFYPRTPPADELRYYADRVQSVDVNATFYRLPEASTFEDWAERTPADFVFAIKASRLLTHVRPAGVVRPG